MHTYRNLTSAQRRKLRIELEHELAWLDRAANLADDRYGEMEADEAGDHGGLAVALNTRTRTRRAEVLDALERMDTGAYGRCVGCGNHLPVGRLIALPEAAHCVSCGPVS